MFVYYYEDSHGLKRGYSNAKDEETFLTEMELLDIEGYIIEYKKVYFKMPTMKIFSSKNKLLFYRNLYSMLLSGSTIPNALEILKEQFNSKKQIQFLDNAINSINNGVKLSVILSGENDFTDMEVTIIRIGEESGDLPLSLGRVCDFLETQYDMKKKTNTIMIYPAIFFTVIYAMGVYLLKENIPDMYEGINVTGAPWFVTWGLRLSEITQAISYTKFVGIYLIGVALAIKLKDILKIVITRILMLVKPIREILLQFHNYEFITYLDIMIRSEIPLTKIFYILKVNSTNPYYKEYEKIETEVDLGNKISESLSPKYFIPLVRGAIMSGEESGDIAFSTEKVREFLGKETLSNQERLTTLIPILMTIIMAFIMLLVVLMFYMPTILFIQQY